MTEYPCCKEFDYEYRHTVDSNCVTQYTAKVDWFSLRVTYDRETKCYSTYYYKET